MNWTEAVKAMAEGKKVRASNWLEGAYISATGQDDIGTGENYNLVLNATWELYDEPERERKPEISEFDKLKYGMFVEVLQTIANHCKDLTK